MKKVIKSIEEYEKKAKMLAHALVVDRMQISIALRDERLAKRISLRSMAKKLNISAAYLSDIELNKRNISSIMLEKLRKL